MGLKRHRTIEKILLPIIVLAIAVIIAFPYYWMIASSVQGGSLFEWPPRLVPTSASLNAYKEVIAERPIARWFRNSTIVSLTTALFSLVIALNAGYALSRWRTRVNTLFGLIILLTQMLPATLLVVPFYVIYRQLQLYNTLIGIAIADTVFVLPLSIWLMKGFFDSIPADLEEQAQVDGCTRLGAFYRITVPLALPGLVVVTVFAFMVGWDDYFFARTLISSESNWVLSVGLTSFQGQYITDWDGIMAAAAMFALPPAIFFLFVQRYLIQGLTGGAVKG
jgi:multiple sugar transport system permease protein